MYVYRRINDGSRTIFDADQHPEVHLTRNDYSFALICKESTKAHTKKKKTDFLYYTIKIRRISPKLWQKCYLEQPLHISVQNSKLIFSAPTTLNYFFLKSGFPTLCMISQIVSQIY